MATEEGEGEGEEVTLARKIYVDVAVEPAEALDIDEKVGGELIVTTVACGADDSVLIGCEE
jgi:hypothetical protein